VARARYPCVLADALALAVHERARLAHELIASLEDAVDMDAADAWLTEIERRTTELNDGTSVLVDWDRVRARWRQRWTPR
jgi:putative addiction module component (TIGR02574 family)